jgi:hypothetical protein
LRISNNGFDKKLINFELFYFWNLTTHSRSGELEYCLEPGKTIKGKRWNLVFRSDIKMLKEIHDRDFTWKIEDFKSEVNESCNPRLQLRLEPAHKMNRAEQIE